MPGCGPRPVVSEGAGEPAPGAAGGGGGGGGGGVGDGAAGASSADHRQWAGAIGGGGTMPANVSGEVSGEVSGASSWVSSCATGGGSRCSARTRSPAPTNAPAASPAGTAATKPATASTDAAMTPIAASTARIAKVRRECPRATIALPAGTPRPNATENVLHETIAPVLTSVSPFVSVSTRRSRSSTATTPYAPASAPTTTIARPTVGRNGASRRTWFA